MQTHNDYCKWQNKIVHKLINDRRPQIVVVNILLFKCQYVQKINMLINNLKLQRMAVKFSYTYYQLHRVIR